MLPTSFKFPKMSFPNFLTMWFCGDRSKNIPPLRILRAADVKHLKSGRQQLAMMKKLVSHVLRACEICNCEGLIVPHWTPRNVLDLHTAIKHMFEFPNIGSRTKRRHGTINWKTYYNLIVKRKGKLYGEY